MRRPPIASAALATVWAVFLAAVPLPAGSEAPYFHTGNDLRFSCTSSGDYHIAACRGFVAGVIDQAELDARVGRASRMFCLPSGVTVGQITDVTRKFLRNNPEILHRPAVALIILAMTDAFPCRR